ncbi:MAG: transglutaminase family protein [Chitinophagales bacterium]
MKIIITHHTEYSFDSEVFLEPHYLRFRPRKTAYADIEHFVLTISPQPTGHRVIRDEENNLIDFCWFDGMTQNLVITAETVIQTTSFNPFAFILHPQNYNQFPFEYDKSQKKLLATTLATQPVSKDLLDYGGTIQKSSNSNTIQYLTNLTKQLHQDFLVEYREFGAPLLPNETFELKRGSCRDLSWMQINLLRHQGFATRFVSGYYYFKMEEPAYELHAWIEVFLPGAGWIGLDPSHGILTGNTHFPIVSSDHFENTMPVSGGIRGSASSTLDTQLLIEII